MNVLISDPDSEWVNKIKERFDMRSLMSSVCVNGKECQLQIYKSKYDVLILDIDTKDHPGLTVLKYMRLNQPGVKVILTFKNKNRFNEFNLNKDDLRRLGASDIFIRPYSLDLLVKSIEGVNQFEAWKNVAESGTIRDEEEITAKDEDFTRIRIDTFYSGNTTIFDHYIRIAPNKFVKILHKGDFFDEARLRKYTADGKVEYLYFRTQDRSLYINFINRVLEKTISTGKASSQLKVKTARNAVEKYMEEIYTTGLRPQLLDEGKKICQNMYDLIQRDQGLIQVLSLYEDYDPPAYAHLFLTSLMSAIIAKNMEWSSSRTVEMVAMGSLLHDIGLLKLPVELRKRPIKDMSHEQLKQYHLHPLQGAEMLQKYPTVPKPVIQIVYQHHETSNGLGYPNELTSAKIYPLAKIVGLADAFTEFIMEKKIPPLQGLKAFISDREMLSRYDSNAIRALVLGFTKDK